MAPIGKVALMVAPIRRAVCVRYQNQIHQYRKASGVSTTQTTIEDVEPSSSLSVPPPTPEQISAFNPIARARRRKTQLPPSRYKFRSPKYYRGPLHPHQPPPPSDPASRLFVPGPFSAPRLQQTYESTFAPDLMSLMYSHHPPGQLPGPIGERLRSWDGSSPYHKGRGLRAPRGSPVLRLSERNITFRNIPTLEKITVHSFLSKPSSKQQHISVAAMAIQAITGKHARIIKGKHTIASLEIRKGEPCGVAVELRGEDMWHFFSKCVEIVMPKIKDWPGVAAKSGDSSGNIGWTFKSDVVGQFPEIQVNFDAYPPKMIPEVNIFCCTTATTDKHARLLLSSLGVPFYGKHVN